MLLSLVVVVCLLSPCLEINDVHHHLPQLAAQNQARHSDPATGYLESACFPPLTAVVDAYLVIVWTGAVLSLVDSIRFTAQNDPSLRHSPLDSGCCSYFIFRNDDDDHVGYRSLSTQADQAASKTAWRGLGCSSSNASTTKSHRYYTHIPPVCMILWSILLYLSVFEYSSIVLLYCTPQRYWTCRTRVLLLFVARLWGKR